MRTRTLALIGLLLVLGASLVQAQGISVVGSLTREATLPPGGKLAGSLLVHNHNDHAQMVRVYQRDYLFQADGRTEYGDPGSVPRSNSAWITFAPHQFSLEPGETKAVYYTLQVPATAPPAGTYWSLLMVEPQADAPPVPAPGAPQVDVRQVWRYAVQVITQIGVPGAGDLKFTNRQLLRDPAGHYHLRVDVANAGDQSLSPRTWAEVFTAQGLSLGRFSGRRTRLYPGCSTRLDLDLTALAPGAYRALVVADNDDDNVFGAQYELEIN
jgi:hypothetical protein